MWKKQHINIKRKFQCIDDLYIQDYLGNGGFLLIFNVFLSHWHDWLFDIFSVGFFVSNCAYKLLKTARLIKVNPGIRLQQTST
jgi:hypothetical protein